MSSSAVVSPQWGNFWNTTKTHRSFKRPWENKICYRNATLQLLFHLPIFLNWVQQCVGSHVDSQGLCQKGTSPDATDGEDIVCKICLLHDLIEAYWNLEFSDDAFEGSMNKFWEAIFNDWVTENPEDGTNRDGQQDVIEFFPELITQLLEDAPGSYPDSLDNIFRIQAFDKHTCAGPNGCGNVTFNADMFDFLPASFSEDKRVQSMEEAIENTFLKEKLEDICTVCNKNPLETELVLGEIPEVLLVHLNRYIEYQTESGELRSIKIAPEIEFSEELIIRKEWLDPRLGAVRKDIKYELSSVLLHVGLESTKLGHYITVSKSRDGSWTLVNDALVRTCDSFGLLAALKEARKYAYIFAYRRLPLVARGPEINLEESLKDPKYSDAEAAATEAPQTEVPQTGAAENNDRMEIDHLASEKGAEDMNIDKNLNQSPQDTVMKDASPPKVAQQGNATEIDLEEKPRGLLEIKFTTNEGTTVLKLEIQGQLRNLLKTKSRRRPFVGGRPVTGSSTRASSSLKPASGAVASKPVKITPKPSKEKSSSKLVNEKKRLPEEPTPRRSVRIGKANTSARMSVRK